MWERCALGAERTKFLESANMDVHVTHQEKRALPTIFAEVTGESGTTRIPYLCHVKTEAADVVVTLRVDGA